MISNFELKQKAGQLQLKTAAVKKINEQLKVRIAEVEAEGRSKEWTTQTIKDLRKKAADDMAPHLTELQQVQHENLQTQRRFWKDKGLIMSKLPLTAVAANPLVAANPVLESTARTNLLLEASKLSSARLAIMAEDAVSDGNFAAAYLYSIENSTRAHQSELGGYVPINLGEIEIPAQTQALADLATIESAVMTSEIDFRESQGASHAELATSRLTAARLAPASV